MNVNNDFSTKVVIDTNWLRWVESPARGVERKFLDRVGNEVARASSLVRYAAKSSFAAHKHEGGEEILVLEGTFSDENGDYPAGTYLRNPPNSFHAPYSEDGCTIFVKLRQFCAGDSATVRINTNSASWYAGLVTGLMVMPLHEFEGVSTALVRWAPNTVSDLMCTQGVRRFSYSKVYSTMKRAHIQRVLGLEAQDIANMNRSQRPRAQPSM